MKYWQKTEILYSSICEHIFSFYREIIIGCLQL